MKTHLLRVAVLALAVAVSAVRADQKTKALDVYWIDSEGGGSTLIVTPNNESVLIDTGNPGGNRRHHSAHQSIRTRCSRRKDHRGKRKALRACAAHWDRRLGAGAAIRVSCAQLAGRFNGHLFLRQH